MARNVDIVINGRDHFSATANKVIGKLNAIDKAGYRVGKGIAQTGQGLARAGMVIGTVVAGGLVAAAKAGADFESQLNTINTIARATPADLSKIGDGLRSLANKGRGDLADLSAGFYDILSAGITDSAKALSVLDAASTLAIGGLSTNAQAVDLLTTAINAYGQDASAATADADLFAKAIEIGKVKADEIAASLANVAPIAAQNGIELREIAAAYGALTAQGPRAAEVTTQMSRAIVELLKPKKELEDFQKLVGVKFIDVARKDGLVSALNQMRTLAEKNKVPFIDLFGRVEAYKFALQTTGPQQKTYNDALDAMSDSAGTAAGQMSERTQGLNFHLGVFKNNLIDAGITISAGFLPALSRALTKMSKALADPETRASLKAFGEDIGKALDNVNWDQVLAGAREFADVLKGALGFAKMMFDAINALPGPIKEAGAGLLVLNKLSGGLVGAGLTNIGGGLLEVAARSGGSQLPGIGKLFAQPVFVTNWAMMGGGPGGMLVSAASTTALATAIGLASGVAIVVALKESGVVDEIVTKADEQIFGPKRAAEIADFRTSIAPGGRLNNIAFGGDSGGPGLVGDLGRTAMPRNAPRATPESVAERGLRGQLEHTADLKGILERGIAAGFHPGVAAIQATFDRNETHLTAMWQRDLKPVAFDIEHRSEIAASLSGIAPAISNLAPPQVTVNVSVSPAGVINRYIVDRRYGPTGSSRNRSSPGWRD